MKKKVVYSYEKRDTIDQKLIQELLDKLYSVSWPRTKQKYADIIKRSFLDPSEQGYQWPIDYYYIPENVQKDIIDDFLEKHNIQLQWKNNIEFLHKILFLEGGINEIYVPTEPQGYPKKRIVETPTLDKIIPEEYCNKVKDLIEDYMHTYNFGSKEYNDINFSVFNCAPSSNRETVIKAWKERGQEINMPQDDAWVDEFDQH